MGTAEGSRRERLGTIVFLTVAFLGSIGLSAAAAATGGARSTVTRVAFVAMLFPALGVLAARLVGPVGELGARRWSWRSLPIALFVLPAVTHAVGLPTLGLLEGRLPWARWLTPDAAGLYHTPASRGWGVLTASGLGVRMAIGAVLSLVLVSLLASLEEVGWRSFLLPRLEARLGARRAMIATAIVWAVWHTPYALSGIHHIEHVSKAAIVALGPLGHVGAGLFLAYLWRRTRSLWIVSLAHGSLNNWSTYAFKFMESSGEHDAALLAAPGVGLLLMGFACVCLTPAGAPEAARLESQTS